MRNILFVISLFLSIFAGSSQVYAQTETSAEKVILAKRFFKAIHMEDTIEIMLNSMVPLMLNQQKQANPNLTPEQMNIISTSANEAMMEILPIYLDRCAEIYAEVFTVRELTELSVFYEGSTGQAMMSKVPALAPKTVDAMMQLTPQLQTSMLAKMCSKMDCKTLKPVAAPI